MKGHSGRQTCREMKSRQNMFSRWPHSFFNEKWTSSDVIYLVSFQHTSELHCLFLPNKADPSTCPQDRWLLHFNVHRNQVKSMLILRFHGLIGRDFDAVGLRIYISARLSGGTDAAISEPYFASRCLNPISSCFPWKLVLSSTEYGLHEARNYIEFITEYSEASTVSGRKNIVKNIYVTVREVEGGMNWDNSTETYSLPYVKVIGSASLMHKAGHPKLVLRDNLER